MTEPVFIDQPLLNQLSDQARTAPRLRAHLPFHPDNGARCHRLLIAIEPGSYIPPHCHQDPEKDETIAVLRGRVGIVFFRRDGTVSSQVLMGPGERHYGVTVPHGMLHSLVALDSGSVFLESKAGPYHPMTAAEQASWAPAENTADAPLYQHQLRALFD